MTTAAIDTFKSLGLSTVDTKAAATPKKQSLGQDEFLKLLTTQLTHQDPSKPMDNGAFMGQMAQFSTVSGIQDLQKSFSDFASSVSSGQALQAASLVGRQVMAASSQGLLAAGGSVAGQFELPASSNTVHVKISDPLTGELVQDLDLGQQAAGNVSFNWDGISKNGQPAKPGTYKIEASATIDGNNTILGTNIASQVKGVTLGSGTNGIEVDLAGAGPIKFSQIKQIL